jgi:hypothetical protein
MSTIPDTFDFFRRKYAGRRIESHGHAAEKEWHTFVVECFKRAALRPNIFFSLLTIIDVLWLTTTHLSNIVSFPIV